MNKRKIIKLLDKLSKLINDNIINISYINKNKIGEEYVIIIFDNEYCKRINISMCSDIELIKSILTEIE